jgi:predicted metal-dependent hydrolase
MTLREAGRELTALRKAAERGEGARRGTAASKPIFSRVFVRGIREYLKPSFHPNDKDHRVLFEETLARLQSEGVVAGLAEKEEEEAAA